MKKMCALFALSLSAVPSVAFACALELMLIVDVSGSVDGTEYALQVDGMAAAFEDSAVVEAIARQEGGILVAVTQWSGASRQAQTIAWTHLTNAGSIAGFSATIRAMPRAWRNFSTAIGEALAHARAVSVQAPFACTRKVIDVSGDGVSNEGRATKPVARGLAAAGYTINGLVIRGDVPDPVRFYLDDVIAGDGAFVEVAEGFEDYGAAFRRKLLREIEPPMIVSGSSADRG